MSNINTVLIPNNTFDYFQSINYSRIWQYLEACLIVKNQCTKYNITDYSHLVDANGEFR